MVKNKFVKILILTLLGLFILFCNFNIKEIQKGREIKIEQLMENSYRSKDNNLYLEFINESIVFYKFKNKKEDNLVYSVNSKFTYEDGLLTLESYDKELENFNVIMLSDDRLYFIELNYILYLDN